MSELKGKSRSREPSIYNSALRDQIYPVTFKTFKRLIVNLAKIIATLRIAVRKHKTDDECARWLYEAFYRDPSIREKYQFKVAPCPRRIREKLLKVLDPELIISEGEPISEQVVVVDGANTKKESKNLLGNQKLRSGDEIVQVDKCGTFIFPVSFQTFENNINKVVVFCKINKTREDGLKMLDDVKLRHRTLKKFYNRFYMLPQYRGRRNYFKECPHTPLAKLLESGRPYDDKAMKTLSQIKERKSLKNNSRKDPKILNEIQNTKIQGVERFPILISLGS
ncbi:protein telomere ends associated-like isoform X2 [Drosophila ficusphila]|uniref:protein telomere ends associated-like isoform X2 n=1 Tax=Drosophila ficusphila TaxID=30025 RepID=UPI0007E72888|nr:protein telomere ends associated-like isoform X2 [Drosophila ficusphila]